jgi:hypothetical protein
MAKKRSLDLSLQNAKENAKASIKATDLSGTKVEMDSTPGVSPSFDQDKPKKPRLGVYVPLKEDGSVDMDRAKDPQALQQAKAALSATGGVQEGKKPVSSGVVSMLIGYYPQLSSRAACVLAKRKRPDLAIEPSAALSYFRFDKDQQKELTEKAMAYLNTSAPEWLRDMLGMVGPGSEFLGTLVAITYMQMQAFNSSLEEMPRDRPLKSDDEFDYERVSKISEQ